MMFFGLVLILIGSLLFLIPTILNKKEKIAWCGLHVSLVGDFISIIGALLYPPII